MANTLDNILASANKLAKQGKFDEIEKLAIDSLTSKKDISDFISEYILIVKSELDNNREGPIELLFNKGYSTDDIAMFLVYQRLHNAINDSDKTSNSEWRSIVDSEWEKYKEKLTDMVWIINFKVY